MVYTVGYSTFLENILKLKKVSKINRFYKEKTKGD